MKSSQVALKDLTQYCDKLLEIPQSPDYPEAHNGLQVENQGKVTRIAAAVDASLETIQHAIRTQADLLLVHHGLFWGPRHPWVGPNHRMFRTLINGNLAVYSAHLPLDKHPQVGNNVLLCKALGLTRLAPFFMDRGVPLGLLSKAPIRREALVERVAQALGVVPVVMRFGPAECRRVGVVTGGGGSRLSQAHAEGVDTFITGEGPHWTYALAQELGINVVYAGHYATETFGVKALASLLADRFGVSWTFLDHPSGL